MFLTLLTNYKIFQLQIDDQQENILLLVKRDHCFPIFVDYVSKSLIELTSYQLEKAFDNVQP